MAAIIPLSNASTLKDNPLINDTWWSMLSYIKQFTPQDAIINTSWAESDYIMSIAKRATVHDAQRQNTPVDYWFNKALLTNSEEEAFGIFRMLNSGSNQAFEELLKILNNDKFLALDLINKMILLNKDEGRILLNRYTKDNNAVDKILKLVYCPTRSGYLLVYDKMVDFIPALSIIANWDFKKFDLWRKSNKLNRNDFIKYAGEKFGYPREYSESLYDYLKFKNNKNILNWISMEEYKFYTSYSEKELHQNSEKIILFDNGLVIDRESLRSYYRDDYIGIWRIPAHLIFISKETIKENMNNEGDKRYSVLLSENDNTYKAILFSSPLAHSLFLRLYFMKGMGLKHFNLVHHEENKEMGGNIYLYKIVWDSQK
jgi:hypothetical protein